MRTAPFLASGILLMGGFLLSGKLFSAQYPEAPRMATLLFVVVWFVVAAVNMWLGVTTAGYSVADELPIFLLIFVVRAALAGAIKWQFLWAVGRIARHLDETLTRPWIMAVRHLCNHLHPRADQQNSCASINRGWRRR